MNPGCEVILQVMNPPVGHTKTSRPNLDAYDHIYRNVAKERGLRLIDHGPAWVGLMKKDPLRFMRYSPDTIHPVRNGSLEVSTPVVLAGLGLAPGNPAASTDDPCWKYMCILMDADKDGTVTRAEFDALWAGYFTKSDTNGDGNLDAGEFHYEELTRGFDANHDGKGRRLNRVAVVAGLDELALLVGRRSTGGREREEPVAAPASASMPNQFRTHAEPHRRQC